MSSREGERERTAGDAAFVERLFANLAGKLFRSDFTVIAVKPLETNGLSDDGENLTCHSSYGETTYARKSNFSTVQESSSACTDVHCSEFAVAPDILRHQSNYLADVVGGGENESKPIATAIGLCLVCGGGYWWRSHRGDLYCVACRPPKRKSPAFVAQRLIYNDDLQALEDFDLALANSGSTPDAPGSSAPQEPLRPQRPRGRGGAGLAKQLPGPPPGVSVDDWWESLVEPGDWFEMADAGERYQLAEASRAADAATRRAAIDAKAGRTAGPAVETAQEKSAREIPRQKIVL